jgi:hypothetical protein
MTYLAHGVDGIFAKFITDIFSFLQTNSMLSSDSTIHGDGSFDHAMYHIFCRLLFAIVVQ